MLVSPLNFMSTESGLIRTIQRQTFIDTTEYRIINHAILANVAICKVKLISETAGICFKAVNHAFASAS